VGLPPGSTRSYVTARSCVKVLSGRCYDRRVLPAWATVAISLGAALITAVSAVVIALWKSHSDRSDSWHTRQTEAASDLSRRFIGAADAVRYSLGNPDDAGGVHNAVHLAGEVTPFLGPVSLLFGGGSPAAVFSDEAVAKLKQAAKCLETGDWTTAGTTLDEANGLREEFEKAVRAVVS
jgi:hypothetical protein